MMEVVQSGWSIEFTFIASSTQTQQPSCTSVFTHQITTLD